MPPIDKTQLRHAVLERLGADLALAQRAAQTAYEAATAKENIAENKYDTLGLEASYLATGQARRVEEIRQALGAFQQLVPRPFDPRQGIQLGALILLADAEGSEQWLFLVPDGAGLKVRIADQGITLITPRAPLGQHLLGKAP
ncbi:MAG TPA: transcription elongation factor GreAB, partial [Pseudomonas sp.]|nr:transcription elongation factor GreAB [Pseudomonas sp.]